MNQPLVSIIVSCHNRADLLPQTMESIFAQSYRPVEIVVVDDGSTDETPKLLKAYGNKIRYVRQQNRGVAVARTTGGRLAKGKFVAFQDDDDLMAPDRISNLMSTLKEYPTAVLSVGDYAIINPQGEVTGERSYFQIHKMRKDPITQPILIEDGYKAILWSELTPLPHTTLFRKKDAEQIGWFDKKFIYACSDTDFFARLGRLGAIVYCPKIVSYYRCGHISIWQNKIDSEFSRLMLFEKHMTTPENKNKNLRKRLNKRMLNTLKRIAILQTKENSFDQIPEGISFKGTRLLNLSNRLNYWAYIRTILPFRKLVLKSQIDQSLKQYLSNKINLHFTKNRKSNNC